VRASEREQSTGTSMLIISINIFIRYCIRTYQYFMFL
jgi:hypothetical protein